MPDEEKLAAIRELLPATAAGIYLATAEAGPLPAETARAMTEAAEWELRTGRGHAAALDERSGRLDEARGAVAAILHADVDRVAVTHSAADALAAQVRHGQRVGLSVDLAPRVLERLREAAAACGASVEPMRSDVPDGIDTLFVPHVTLDGRVLPVAEYAARVPATIVDGSLAVGAIPVDVEGLSASAYATDAHRWLLGPAGMGAIWVRDDAGGTALGALEHTEFHGPSVVGMARSAGWLAMYVGLDWVTDRTAALAQHLAERIVAINGVEVRTPLPPPAGIVAFRLPHWPQDVAHDELGRRAFAIVGQIAGWLQASVGAFNTDAEIDRFAESVALLAAHTPESLPRRANLTILHETRG
jgi:selenocysteine lyase/cysteine desulfurase